MTDNEKLMEQLAELQSQMAFQDETVAALNEAVADQQQQILVLRRQLQLLQQRQEEQAARFDAGSGSSPDEKPPHY